MTSPTVVPSAAPVDTALRAMQADLAVLRATASNLANANTPGYRRELAPAGTFAALVGQATAALDATAPATTVDHRSGPLQLTHRTLDVAVAGSGYLQVMTEQGVAYTRHGALRVDAQGRLVSDAGHAVLGDAGELLVDGENLLILPNGEVRQGDRRVGRLQVVQFDDRAALMPVGQGLYRTSARPTPVDAPAQGVLKVGFLEGSNVSPAREMLRLNETMRHFEALQRVVQGYDETLEKAIRKLGEL